jgi:hypothetical protein
MGISGSEACSISEVDNATWECAIKNVWQSKVGFSNEPVEIYCSQGVTAIITGSAPDVLSHAAVRARNSGTLLAACFDKDRLFEMKSLLGTTISLASIQVSSMLTFGVRDLAAATFRNLTLIENQGSDSPCSANPYSYGHHSKTCVKRGVSPPEGERLQHCPERKLYASLSAAPLKQCCIMHTMRTARALMPGAGGLTLFEELGMCLGAGAMIFDLQPSDSDLRQNFFLYESYLDANHIQTGSIMTKTF